MTDGTPTAATACKAAGTAAKAFSRQKRQQSSAGKRKADLSWLQGDDDATPASSTKQQHFSYPVHAWATSDSLLCESTEAEAHPDSNEANDTELKLLNGVVTW